MLWDGGDPARSRDLLGQSETFDASTGTVVAASDAADADGRGSIDFGDDNFRYTILKAQIGGTNYPLSSQQMDPYFRVGLIQHPTDPLLFALVCSDATWGYRVGCDNRTKRWRPAEEFADQDSCIIVMGWAAGVLTVAEAGVLQVGAEVDFRLTYTTDDGEHEALYQPVSPSNSWDVGGQFETIAGGIVEDQFRNDGKIIFPRGMGAFGHRDSGDSWPNAPTPERKLTKVEMLYKQESVEVTEGVDALLDVASVTITINGPANAKYSVAWYGQLLRRNGTLDGAGTATVTTSLPGARYHITLYHPSDTSKGGIVRQTIELDAGETTTVTFAGSWTDYSGTPYLLIGYVWKGGAALEGETIWAWQTTVPFTGWVALTTTAADGSFSVDTTLIPSLGYIAVLGDNGSAMAILPDMALTGFWWDANVAGSFAAIETGNAPPLQNEGLHPWGEDGSHVNVPPGERAAYVLDDETSEKFYFRPTPSGMGVWTDPLPKWIGDPTDTVTANDAIPQKTYSVYDADGTLLQGSLNLVTDDNAPWSGSDPNLEGTFGQSYSAEIGGKINGIGWEADQSLVVTDEDWKEIVRLGGEFGGWEWPIEHRHSNEDVTVPMLTFDAWECPYCRGPVWTDPTTATYTRWFCIPCKDNGKITDARAYFSGAPFAAISGWKDRFVKTFPGGWVLAKTVEEHLEPAKYEETGDFLVSDWLGLGLDRWVAQHIVFGTIQDGAFVDGESIADIETELGRTVGPVMLKLEILSDYMGGGETITVTVTKGGSSRDIEVDVPVGARTGDLFPLEWAPHSDWPSGFFDDVTAVSGMTVDLHGRLVNDGPAMRDAGGVTVVRQAYAPYACDVAFADGDVHHRVDAADILWQTYVVSGVVYCRSTHDPAGGWSEAVAISTAARFAYPRIATLRSGRLQITAFDLPSRRTVRFQSRDRNLSWEGLPVTGIATDLQYADVADHAGTLFAAGLDAGAIWCEFSTDEGATKAEFQGGATRKRVADATGTPKPTIEILGSRVLVVSFTRGSAVVDYVSRDGGETWAGVG